MGRLCVRSITVFLCFGRCLPDLLPSRVIRYDYAVETYTHSHRSDAKLGLCAAFIDQLCTVQYLGTLLIWLSRGCSEGIVRQDQEDKSGWFERRLQCVRQTFEKRDQKLKREQGKDAAGRKKCDIFGTMYGISLCVLDKRRKQEWKEKEGGGEKKITIACEEKKGWKLLNLRLQACPSLISLTLVLFRATYFT